LWRVIDVIREPIRCTTLHKTGTSHAVPSAPTIAAMGVWIAVTIGIVALLVVAGVLAARLRSVQGTVDDSWQQVLLALHRRRGLAGELAEAVRTRSGAEIDLVDRMRVAIEVADLPGASPDQQVSAERELEDVLGELSRAVVGSPALIEDVEVAALLGQMKDAERRVEARRAGYEQGAAALHRRSQSLPWRWIARSLGISILEPEGEK
jgi:hypothetical protein